MTLTFEEMADLPDLHMLTPAEQTFTSDPWEDPVDPALSSSPQKVDEDIIENPLGIIKDLGSHIPDHSEDAMSGEGGFFHV